MFAPNILDTQLTLSQLLDNRETLVASQALVEQIACSRRRRDARLTARHAVVVLARGGEHAAARGAELHCVQVGRVDVVLDPLDAQVLLGDADAGLVGRDEFAVRGDVGVGFFDVGRVWFEVFLRYFVSFDFALFAERFDLSDKFALVDAIHLDIWKFGFHSIDTHAYRSF
jgi:hypothetical protein